MAKSKLLLLQIARYSWAQGAHRVSKQKPSGTGRIAQTAVQYQRQFESKGWALRFGLILHYSRDSGEIQDERVAFSLLH
jgi:hypothetical protein